MQYIIVDIVCRRINSGNIAFAGRNSLEKLLVNNDTNEAEKAYFLKKVKSNNELTKTEYQKFLKLIKELSDRDFCNLVCSLPQDLLIKNNSS